ncbi:MAG: recombinase family protein [Patescibacteria group bacterium]|nr:recombinase family protein [Patescibacteria group bacterium]
MRVVSYARVSTVGQESRGQSLPNQERAFTSWLERTGHVRIAAYREAASAGTVDGRAEFGRLLADLPTLQPDAIIVDTLDRFTRDLRGGLNLLDELRGHRVGLLPLDWARERPIDVDEDRDWQDVVEEFTGAERERRRIRRRVLRAYQGRLERGATFTNRLAYGLARRGDHLEPGPAAWVIAEIDRLFLEGGSVQDVYAWVRASAPDAWGTRNGVHRALRCRSYVTAGVRAPETQAAIDQRLVLARDRYGRQDSHGHALAGVVACGLCVELGFARESSLMSGHAVSNRQQPRLDCTRTGNGRLPFRHARLWTALAAPLELDFRESLRRAVAEPAALARMMAAPEPARARSARKRAAVDRQLEEIAARRAAALDLAGERSPGVRRQVAQALEEIDRQERAALAVRDRLRREAANQRGASPQEVIDLAGTLLAAWEVADARAKNRLARLYCSALGVWPVATRRGRGDYELRW